MENLKEILFRKTFNYCNEFYKISEPFNPYTEISETEKRLSLRASTLMALISEAGLMDEYNIWKAMKVQSRENESLQIKSQEENQKNDKYFVGK